MIVCDSNLKGGHVYGRSAACTNGTLELNRTLVELCTAKGEQHGSNITSYREHQRMQN